MNNASLKEQIESLSIESLKALSELIKSTLNAKYEKDIIEPIEKELREYFKNHEAGGFQIEDFFLMKDIGFDTVTICPRDPDIDEEYDDDKCDEDIKKIGEKYGVNLSWAYSVYPK